MATISSASSTSVSLAPGFRFLPTDEELVSYYLRRKICGKTFGFDAISEIDIYKIEPWDLPGKSRLKSRDLECFFFSSKYGNGLKTNRATDRGYWKTTGKDRPVYHKSVVVGMKKTLVYHNGRPPRGERTNWVMQEFRLIDEELEKSGIVQDAFVLCRVFRKSGSGPKNGEQYGAPFVEEKWEDEEVAVIPKEESKEEAPVGDVAYPDENELPQILGADVSSEVAPLPLNLCNGDNSNLILETSEFNDAAQKLLLGMNGSHCDPDQPDDPSRLFDLPVQQHDISAKSVEHEYIGEPSHNSNPSDGDSFFDRLFSDVNDNFPFDDTFLKANDLKNPVEADTSGFDMIEEFLTSLDDADGDNYLCMNDHSSMRRGNEDLVFDQTSFFNGCINEEAPQGIRIRSREAPQRIREAPRRIRASRKQLLGNDNGVVFPSEKHHTESGSDIQYPYDVTLRYSPPSVGNNYARSQTNQSSNRRIRLSRRPLDIPAPLRGVGNNHARFQTMRSITTGKASSAIFMFTCFMFIWVLTLSVIFKIGTYIFAN